MSNQPEPHQIKPRMWAFVGAILVLLLVPAGVYAGHRFADVPGSHIFHGDISWLADNDVTRGCNPPVNDRFCPDDNVTRGQMAAFMRRLAEGRVVAARTADFASDAETLNGRTRQSLLGAGTGNQQLRTARLSFSPPETLSQIDVTTGDQGLVAFVHFSGFFTMTGVSPTTTDHQFLCWTSATELSAYDPAQLPDGYWWRTYPAGSVGVATSAGPQHAVPFSFTLGRFVPPNSSLTLFSQCADLFAGDAPTNQEFFVQGTANAWAIPSDTNNFQPAGVDFSTSGGPSEAPPPGPAGPNE